MISHLAIKNFAIIENLKVDFHKGLNIITGETGAGKSIIIEAINHALGSRADTAFVRTGTEKALIQLIFDIDSPKIVKYMGENDIDIKDGFIISREILSSGKSISKINDNIVSLSFLNKICRRLADIHGQYDHQALLDIQNHINILDSSSFEQIDPVKSELYQLYSKYSTLRSEFSALISQDKDKARKKDLLTFELSEIEDAHLIPDEDTSLSERLLKLQNSEKINSAVFSAYHMLFEAGDSVFSTLAKVTGELSTVSSFDTQIANFKEIAESSYYSLEDLAADIRKYKDTFTFSEEDLNETVSRLDLIKGLKRKFGNSIEEILKYKEKIANEILTIENCDTRIEELKNIIREHEEKLLILSKELSKIRKNIASRLIPAVEKELKELNFDHGVFDVSFTEITTTDGKLIFTANGIDNVEFIISPNKGEPPKPLAKIASGGEISRIMLALKSILTSESIPSVIFDEIDTGVSGATASIVGKKLLALSKNSQIICITHLPQVAAYGNQNYKIEKSSDEKETFTGIVPLSDTEKVNEIARLLGGTTITENAIKNALDLIKNA